MIKAAIIGLGWWGQHIVSTLQNKSEKIRFVRAVDLNLGASQQIAAQHSLELSSDLGDALEDAEVEAIVLATPHSLHEVQILAAASAGKHVFCEKPLALTRESAEKAVAACDAAGIILGLGHERRFEPAMIEIKNLIKSGSLGDIMLSLIHI